MGIAITSAPVHNPQLISSCDIEEAFIAFTLHAIAPPVSDLERHISPVKNSGYSRKIRHTANKPAAEFLPQCIVRTIEDINEYQPCGDFGSSAIDILHQTD